MGTTASLPEEVILNTVAPYCFRNRKRNDFLSLRATCKLGLDLARRYLTATTVTTRSAFSSVRPYRRKTYRVLSIAWRFY
jgi:hypothetical protein